MNVKEKLHDVKEKVTGPADFQMQKIELAKKIVEKLTNIENELKEINKKLVD